MMERELPAFGTSGLSIKWRQRARGTKLFKADRPLKRFIPDADGERGEKKKKEGKHRLSLTRAK